MPDHLGADMRKEGEKDNKGKDIKPLDATDVAIMKSYGQNFYYNKIKTCEEEIKEKIKSVNEISGIKESDTGLAHPALWDLKADADALKTPSFDVARCTKSLMQVQTMQSI